MNPSSPFILRIAAVQARTGIRAKSTLYQMIAKGEFPKPRKLSSRSVGWISSEVDAWINSRPTNEKPLAA